eukprot:COSAG01_NODE_6697_length_3539_cov_4.359302_1_plen_48_part_10
MGQALKVGSCIICVRTFVYGCMYVFEYVSSREKTRKTIVINHIVAAHI